MHRREGGCEGVSQAKWGIGSDGSKGFEVRFFSSFDAGEGLGTLGDGASCG